MLTGMQAGVATCHYCCGIEMGHGILVEKNKISMLIMAAAFVLTFFLEYQCGIRGNRLYRVRSRQNLEIDEEGGGKMSYIQLFLSFYRSVHSALRRLCGNAADPESGGDAASLADSRRV